MFLIFLGMIQKQWVGFSAAVTSVRSRPNVVCCVSSSAVSVANSVDPDQTAPFACMLKLVCDVNTHSRET